MHETSLATTVLTVLRDRPGPYPHVRVHVGDLDTRPEDLAARLRTHLDAADPPVTVATIEVILRARPRLCAACTHTWTSADPDAACPACGGPPLPLLHDHHVDVELVE
jgi:Zn finger protein HypA/HybF involved in hydrogenase expression